MAKRIVLAALLLIPLSLSAAQIIADPDVRIEMRNAETSIAGVAYGTTSRVIVEFRDPPLARRAKPASRRVVGEYRQTFDRFRADLATMTRGRRDVAVGWEYFEAFNGVSLKASPEVVAQIRALPYVKRVQRDVVMQAYASSEAAPPANVRQVNADKAWARFGTRGDGVVVAVIDTGIDYMHPALGGGFGPGHRVVGGYDFVNHDADPRDDAGHGTHVAGIIGGRSDQLLGVAPDVTFLAYKVLDASGSGPESNVLAGIERAVDPNGDGDLSDHAAVANMSLGGPGGPDDPLSEAVDNATQAGVVFVIAAGNSHDYHTIGSPGTARSAITVGAVNASDAIAIFSSRGPNMKDLAVKPEVVAPGEAIVSSVPGGLYQPKSGTSMAAPHVAGVAALVRAANPGWSAEQVKSAIVTGAFDAGFDAMSQGNGRVDAMQAAGATLEIEPAVLSFGLDEVQRDRWSSTATFRVTNRDATAVTVTLAPVAVTGVTMALDEAWLSLQPGESRDVTALLSVDNGAVMPASGTYVVGGSIAVSIDGQASRRVTWGFTKAARLTVASDKGDKYIDLGVLVNADTALFAAPVSDSESEAIVPPASYDVIAFATPMSSQSGGVSLYRRASQNVGSDVMLRFATSDAPNRVLFDAHDSRGRRLRDARNFLANLRLLLPDGWKAVSIYLPPLVNVGWLMTGNLTGMRLLATEEMFDFEGGEIAVIQHPPVTEFAPQITLGDVSGIASTNVHLFIPPGVIDRHVQIMVNHDSKSRSEWRGAEGMGWRSESAEWNGRVEMTPDATPDYPVSLVATGYGDFVRYYDTPPLSANGGRVAPRVAPPWSFDNETLWFGFGPNLPNVRLRTDLRPPMLVTGWAGERGDTRWYEAAHATISLFDDAGTQVIGPISASLVPLPPTAWGAYRVEVVSSTKNESLSLGFDTRRSDASPPTITSFVLSDSVGRSTTDLAPATGARLRFSLLDDKALDGAATRVWWRLHGATQWLPLSAVQVAEDSNYGTLFFVDLAHTTDVPSSLVDMKIESADVAGNVATLRLEPAFAVQAAAGVKPRAAR